MTEDIKELIKRLKQDNDIVDVIGKRVSLTKRGSEYVGKCCFHNDTKASLQVNSSKQVFACFPCGAKGDIFDFLTAYGLTFAEAIEELKGGSVEASGPEKNHVEKREKPVQWKQIPPLAGVAPDFDHYKHGKPSNVWSYRSDSGSVIGYICRFDTPSGKEVIPYIFATDGKRQEWRWQGFDNPRLLYNLDQIKARPNDSVLIVEGEKTADAASRLLPHVVVTCWIGGSNAIKRTDWTPLHGRKVIYWPDNDYTHAYGDKHEKAGQVKPYHEQPGNAAMLAIAGILEGNAAGQKWIDSPDGTPCGWDIADATDWTPEIARDYARSNIKDVPKIQETEAVSAKPIADQTPEPANDPDPIPEPKPKPVKIIPPPLPPIPEDDEDDEDDDGGKEFPYFQFLGYEKTENTQLFCFYVKSSKIICKYSASGLSKNNLITIAPLNFWEAQFRGPKGGFSIDQAVSWLISASNKVGIYTDKNIRGRGAWVDGTRVVIHNGSELIIEGHKYQLGSIKTKFVYEAAEHMGFVTEGALNNKEASQLIQLSEMLSWERSVSGRLLAGWCVIAPICGALKWRPHIWITGPAGTGKTWVFQNIVRRALGDTAVTVQGETSEAGLRQLLNQDALPVVFDEADVDDKQSVDRVQKVLTLMRAASADDGGLMAKGTAGGIAKTFRIRTCFAFASIGVQVHNQADRSRVTILALQKKDGDEGRLSFEDLLEFYDDVFTPEFAQRLRARTLLLAPVILKNAETFSTAAAAVIGDQRAGDQLGAMLAGAFSLRSTKEISYSEALEWVKSQDWSEEMGSSETRDEQALFSKIMGEIVRIDGNMERTIGELITTSVASNTTEVIETVSLGLAKLNRIGIKLQGEYILISNTSEEIRKILANTSWAKNHNRVLMRLPGATTFDNIRFGSGIKTRAVGIPVKILLD